MNWMGITSFILFVVAFFIFKPVIENQITLLKTKYKSSTGKKLRERIQTGIYVFFFVFILSVAHTAYTEGQTKGKIDLCADNGLILVMDSGVHHCADEELYKQRQNEASVTTLNDKAFEEYLKDGIQ